MSPTCDFQRAYAQNTPEKVLAADFYPEAGCPVNLNSVRSVMDIDPFGAPTSSKVYLTYTNNSSQAVIAVKFRCRFSDAEGKDRGTFHAIDSVQVLPGASRSHKWKRDAALSPGVSSFQIRVLQVKMADGSLWQSVKMQELINGETESSSSGAKGAQRLPAETPAYLQSPPQSQVQPQEPPQEPPGYENGTKPAQQEQGYDKNKELPW